MNEIWKDIKGYEGLYKISSLGRIWSNKRDRTISFDMSCGYYRCTLSNKEIKHFMVNRLVYESFIGSIPSGYEIHHINENRTDNRIENLELIKKEEHLKKHKSIPICQYTIDGRFIKEYPSLADAYRETGIYTTNISRCCKGKLKVAYGYVWKYKKRETV